MNILITGGAGFVGSSLTKSLLSDGHNLTIIDNFATSKNSNITDISDQITFVDMDLSNPNCEVTVDYYISRSDVVYHLAASIGVQLIQQQPSASLHNSLNMNNILFPLFEKHQTKVIFSSTSEVYGETRVKTGSVETDHLEIHPPQKPRGSYACSKLLSEFLIRSYTFPNTIIRFFNVVGPTQVPDYGHVLPRFINQLREGKPLSVYGNGQQVRSFCDIRDAVEMLKLMIGKEHNDEIYNIGSDENVVTMNMLADTCIRLSGVDSVIKYQTFEEAFGTQFEEIYIRFPNTDKIKQYYTCKYNLEDIIRNIL